MRWEEGDHCLHEGTVPVVSFGYKGESQDSSAKTACKLQTKVRELKT